VLIKAAAAAAAQLLFAGSAGAGLMLQLQPASLAVQLVAGAAVLWQLEVHGHQ
jgi:hypothetical protein